MVSLLPSAIVIECPHCGTRYQVAADALGPRGRKVACAHCGKTWQAESQANPAPEHPDTLFDEAAERNLDDAFGMEEQAAAPPPPAAAGAPDAEARMRSMADIRAAIAPRPKPAEASPDPNLRKRQRAFSRRQYHLARQLPLARVRRAVRLFGLSALTALIVGGIAFRTEIVRQFPDLAGAYEALGLGVNVVGLEFRDVTTLVALRNGTDVMQVDARIYSVAARNVAVPPVVVTLLDDAGTSLYEWSVAPEVRRLGPGEVVDFSTQLSSPPAAATEVRLTFTDGKAPAASPAAAATQQGN